MTITSGTDREPSGRTRRADIGRRELLTFLSATMALMALAIDMILPALDDMRESFGLAPDDNRVAQVITVFFFGLAIAQLVFGPLADRYGRLRTIYVGIAIYVVGAVASALAPTLELLLASRFLWAFGAAAARVAATAMVRDRFEGTAMARALSEIMAVFVMVPVFAPALGAGVNAVLPWQAIFWFCAVWALMIVLWSLRIPETLAPENRQELEWRSMAATARRVVTTRSTIGYTLATVFVQGVFTAYLASSELIFGEILGRGDQFPFIFGAIAVLFAVGALVNGQIVERFGIMPVVWGGLVMWLAGSGVLLALATGAGGRPNFWAFTPALAIMLSSFMAVMPNLNSAAMLPMGDIAGAASSLTSAIRLGGGAVLGAIVAAQVDTTVTPFVVFLVVFALCATACVYVTERDPAVEAAEGS